jgi:hypothetical protein
VQRGVSQRRNRGRRSREIQFWLLLVSLSGGRIKSKVAELSALRGLIMTMKTTSPDRVDKIDTIFAVVDGRCCIMCGLYKRKADFPLSIRKIQSECRACLFFRTSGSVNAHEDDSGAALQPQFHLIHGAEIV